MKTIQIQSYSVTWHDPITGIPLEPGKSNKDLIHWFDVKVNWQERFNRDFEDKLAGMAHKESPEANFWEAYCDGKLICEGWI